MKKTLPTATIAVCAYNEENNIGNLLESVLSQKESHFILEKILVISDGSTDMTAHIVKSFKNPKIELNEILNRKGKSFHLNTIYRKVKSDFLIQTDADVVFSNPLIISHLIATFETDKAVMMCGGNPTPVKAKTFVEEAINATFNAYKEFRSKVRDGNNVFSADGRLLAFRREFYSILSIPTTMIANDAYAYFFCLSKGYKYKFVKEAIVFFRSPQTLKDQLKQNSRFQAAPIRMRRYFADILVGREYSISPSLYWRVLLVQFIKKPIHCGIIFLFNMYCRFQAKINERKMTAKWDMAKTTKITG